jgi:hypothetical protein
MFPLAVDLACRTVALHAFDFEGKVGCVAVREDLRFQVGQIPYALA